MKRVMICMLTAIMLSSCLTRIITYDPRPTPQAPAPVITTTVRAPQATIITTTPSAVAPVTAINYYEYLDLRAIAAAFAQAQTVEQFEYLLNSNQYMITNLDLNQDGYIDYLRVMESYTGYNHVLTIQAVLGWNMFQNVAKVIVECGPGATYVQVVGDIFIYGRNYIIEPVFIHVPPMYAYMNHRGYNPWHSPYYWDHFPPHYHHPAPVPPSHYHAYVDTYMRNHSYCNEVRYSDSYHYSGYDNIGRENDRNDYRDNHPTESFNSRYSTNNNAREISSRSVTTTQQRNTQTRNNTPTNSTTGTSARTTTTSTSERSSNPSVGSSNRTNTTTRTTTTNTTQTPATQQRTTGVTTTTTRPTTTTSTSSRTTTSSTSTTNRTTTTSSSQSSSSRATSSSSSARTVTPSTTTTTRVKDNGTTTRTTTRTVDTNGRTTTTSSTARTAAPTTTRSTSSSTSSSSRSTSGSSSSSSSRTQSTSSRR